MQEQIRMATLWPQIKQLIDDGCSLIPVRDKDEGERPAKTPCISAWKQYQTERMDEGALWQAMQTYGTSAVAVVTGEVSGRLELIDIDSKYEPGIEALVLKDIEKLYPDLYPILRIHATPSGGRHIIYRIEDGDVEGNQKLAGREATEAELQDQRKKGRKRLSTQVNFLETRGEGGYFLYPPSMGYSVIQDVPIPQLTWEERCGIINLCRSYNRLVKIEPTPKPTKKEDDWYTTNPFEDFNENCDPVQLIEEFGWKRTKHFSDRFFWFTRPGKDKGVSASFNRSKRVFYIFTSSTELEPTRGYNPASILAELRHGGNKKEAYHDLVKSGYGKVKRQIEQAVIKKAAIKGTGIPSNFSDEAKADHIQLAEKYNEDHPHGTFWEYNKQGDFVINLENLLTVAVELGFRSFNGTVVQVNGKFVTTVDDIYFFDTIKDYIKEDNEDVAIEIKNVYERFLKTYGSFITSKRLAAFDDEDILTDSADACYKFYANCFVEITASKIRIKPYEELSGYVWSHKMLDREYHIERQSSNLYEQYLINSTSVTGKIDPHVKNIIGWLCHDYNSAARLYMVVMTERVLDPKEGGGSGKNIFAGLLANVIGMSTASGSMVKWDDKFYAVWKPGNRLYFVPDLPKVIDWTFLKNAIENPLINKKYDREISINMQETPKLLLNTNYSFADVDGGLKRRIRIVEFTDYYTINGGVDTVHGKLFPAPGSKGDWAQEDWKGFDDMILHCIQHNLAANGKIESVDLSETGWIKKFITMYGEDNYDFIRDNIQNWVKSDYVKASDFQVQYDNHISELKERYKLGKKKLMSAVKEFCERYDINFEQSMVKRIAHETVRTHIFTGNWEQFNVYLDEDDGIPF
ncbi:bifunctional DNA primase/polymerase [Sphingobacterium spiritivorum]|uniref:Bifunctional DNA primase/polymerase domain protein n=1 Tax=Sphingobacterium spiritivorum ATCC 33861 TaxID=525373 RepID=D7VN35_SPHSI|nr:bifunctional DNA primase/polymerase [Sphingobacterium spiritivorum]EFK57332.1 bifunctional DNA primase/polymerase domain protein [Sphingobacterium spiritivorum ATCC 33861]QQT36587.1 bifunctional DNA primase/polymerase [Sphingobacterium spiritivorum]WQD33338.1 bifunctional DNA primase/polymerase [Sphingobacterium spiritivorum]SUJ22182.1 Bifunctional DNA primase/polymerase, N-terminal [Sphingobacterium spiritivorum]